VDKVVDNVENYELSTGISLFSSPAAAFRQRAYRFVYPVFFSPPLRVTSPVCKIIFLLKRREKVGFPGKIAVKIRSPASFRKKYLLKSDKKEMCIIFLPLEILNLKIYKHRRYPMQGKVEICGVNTSHLVTLPQSEMNQLLRQVRQGDETAREKLIEGNLRLVLSVIQRFDKRGESPDDLFQVGCIGLIKAISNFDPDKEVRFSTYGVPMIAGEVRRYLRDNSVIRISRSIRDMAYRVLQCKEAMQLRLGREPALEEIARELSLPVEEITQALDAVCAPVSLYDPVYSDGGDPLTVMDQVKDRKNTEEGWMDHITLRLAFQALQPREKEILSLRFYDGKTQMEVATHLGISQAQVSRLEKGAIQTMRKFVSVS